MREGPGAAAEPVQGVAPPSGEGQRGEEGDRAERGERRERRVSRRERRRRRRRRRLVALGVVLVLASGAWLAGTAYLARTDLLVAQEQAGALRADLLDGRTADASARLPDLQDRTGSARRWTSGPLWAVAARLPLLGPTAATTRGLARAADDLSTGVFPDLVTVGETLDPERLTARVDGVDLAPFLAARPALDRADTSLASVVADVSALPERAVVPPVVDARTAVVDQLSELAPVVSDAADAAALLPPLLGADGPRRYFVALQNPAEARGTGGLVGAYALMGADDGVLTVEDVASNESLVNAGGQVRPLDSAFSERYAPWGPAQRWTGSNVTPDFPSAAASWVALWEAQSGQVLDGAVAVDPFVLQYLLDATGPLPLSSGDVVDGGNAAQFLLRDINYLFTLEEEQARDDLLVEAARGTLERLTTGSSPVVPVAAALRRASSEGRLLVSSTRVEEDRRLTGLGIGGRLDGSGRPTAQVVVNNARGNKIDWWLERSVAYRAGRCDADRRTSTVSVTLTSAAESVESLPPLALTVNDSNGGEVPAGQTRMYVSLFATRGAVFTGATLDGEPVGLETDTEQGRPVYSLYLELPVAGERTLEITLDEPTATGEPVVPEQPLSRPQETVVDVPVCG